MLQLPAVADKTFLVTIGDRTVGGLCSRDPMVGPWQVPVADVAVTLMDYTGYAGEAMAMGERTPLALIDAPASGRMAVGEAITNLAAAGIRRTAATSSSRRTGWRPRAIRAKTPRSTTPCARSRSTLAFASAWRFPSARTRCRCARRGRTHGVDKAVTAPISLIVSAFAPVPDVRRTLTPLLQLDQGDTTLLLIDVAEGRRRLGGSALAQVYGQLGNEAPDLDDPDRLAQFFAFVQQQHRQTRVLAYHDVADGGLFATLAEMAFASRAADST